MNEPVFEDEFMAIVDVLLRTKVGLDDGFDLLDIINTYKPFTAEYEDLVLATEKAMEEMSDDS